MGRFYKTSKPEYLDFIYKQPNNLLLKAVEKAEAGVDKNLASVADLYGRLKSEALTPDTERRNEIIEGYKTAIDDLSMAIYKDPMSFRGYTPTIKKTRDAIMDNLERGELAAIASNVTARSAYKDKLDAQVKSGDIDQTVANELLTNYDADFAVRRGTMYAGPKAYQTYKTGFVSKQIDPYTEVDKLLKGMASDQQAWANAGLEVEIKGDSYLLKDKTTKEYIDMNEVGIIADQILQGHEPINQYYDTRINQGISGFTQQRKINDYNRVKAFLMGKLGFTKFTADKSVAANQFEMMRGQHNLTKDASSETYNSDGGITRNDFGNTGNADENLKASDASRKAYTDYRNKYVTQVDESLKNSKVAGEKAGFVPVTRKYNTKEGIIQDQSFAPISQCEYKDGKWQFKDEKNASEMITTEEYNEYKAAYNSAQGEIKKDLVKQFDDRMNTGSDWEGGLDAMNNNYDGEFSTLGIFYENGNKFRSEEHVKKEKANSNLEEQYINMWKEAKGISGDFTKEQHDEYKKDLANFLDDINTYNLNLETSTDILESAFRMGMTKENAKAEQIRFNENTKEGGKWHSDSNRMNVESTRIRPLVKYDAAGNKQSINETDIETGNRQALIDAGRILFEKGENQQLTGQTVNLNNGNTAVIKGFGRAQNKSITEVTFLVDKKEYTLKLGKLTYSYDQALPGKYKTGDDFNWVQEMEVYGGKAGENATEEEKAAQGEKFVYQMITPGSAVQYKTDKGIPVNSYIKDPMKIINHMANDKFESANKIAKNTREKMKTEMADKKLVETKQSEYLNSLPYHPILYKGLGKDVNIFVRQEAKGLQYYSYNNGKYDPISKEMAKRLVHQDVAYQAGYTEK